MTFAWNIFLIWLLCSFSLGVWLGYGSERDNNKQLAKELDRNYHEMEMLREIIFQYEKAPIRLQGKTRQ
jgi:hypothetical protein